MDFKVSNLDFGISGMGCGFVGSIGFFYLLKEFKRVLLICRCMGLIL